MNRAVPGPVTWSRSESCYEGGRTMTALLFSAAPLRGHAERQGSPPPQDPCSWFCVPRGLPASQRAPCLRARVPMATPAPVTVSNGTCRDTACWHTCGDRVGDGRELLLAEAGDVARVPALRAEAAGLGGSQGVSLGRMSRCRLCGLLWGSLQVERNSDHPQPTPPAPFVSAAAA